ncbi:MAG: LCP family protein [Beutenbergiaceae bacterium]
MPRHATSRPRRVLRTIAVAAVGVMTFLGAGTATAWYELQSNISTPSVAEYLPADRPTSEAPPIDALSDGAVNILVMGSDSREGANSGFGGDVEGMRSDTTLLVHIAADRSRVEVISIPRDLIVEIPACTLPDGSQSAYSPLGYNEHSGVRFNTAFSNGAAGGDLGAAAACTISAFETMSGIYIDDFVIVDFSGFQAMVDAIGGVELCFDEPIEDDKAKLSLEAGCHVLTGEQALALARARKGLGDGSDIGRISRQQELLAAMVAKATSTGVAANPAALLSFLDAATASLTTSERLGDLTTMVGLGYSLREVGPQNVTFATMPFDWSGNVVLQNEASDALWDSVSADVPMVLPTAPPDATDDGVAITVPGQPTASPTEGTGDSANEPDTGG